VIVPFDTQGADVFRDHARMAPANASHGQPGQCNLRSAIEHCRTAALRGISKRCEKCTLIHQ
jgi:hypothetical protein